MNEGKCDVYIFSKFYCVLSPANIANINQSKSYTFHSLATHDEWEKKQSNRSIVSPHDMTIVL